MYILHGTWIPDESDTFIQSGQFYLWVETDTAHKRRSPGVHPGHIKKDELASFLQDTLKIAPLAAMSRAGKQTKPTIEPEIVSRYFLLPSDSKSPLPSWEMANYLETEIPEKIHWDYWEIHCYPVQLALSYSERVNNVIQLLHELYFLTQHRILDVQMGADLLFWHQYTQELKQIIWRDQYIPALKYRSTTPRMSPTKGRAAS